VNCKHVGTWRQGLLYLGPLFVIRGVLLKNEHPFLNADGKVRFRTNGQPGHETIQTVPGGDLSSGCFCGMYTA